MKGRNFLIFALAFFALASCKKETAGSGDTIEKLATVVNIQEGAAVKFNEVYLSTGDTLHSLLSMAHWCLLQPEVENAFIVDDYMIELHFTNGLISPIVVIPLDANGTHLTRGGGKSGSLAKITNTSTKTIENNKVMIFLPYDDEFYPQGYNLLHKFSDGEHTLEPTLLLGKQADLDAINTFKDYGLIILNTHGTYNGFLIKTKIEEFDEEAEPGGAQLTEEQLKSMMLQANNIPLDKIENGELELGMNIHVKENGSGSIITCSKSILVTTKYIRKIPKLNEAIVFGNHCSSGFHANISGQEDILPDAWKSAGAISYYGYAFDNGRSTSVSNEFARQMEDSLITNLLYDLDSTGIAHLAYNTTGQFEEGKTMRTGGVKVPANSITVEGVASYTIEYTEDYPQILAEFYFQHFDNIHYSYDQCGDTITDARDGQKYATVCIGEQVWMAENLNWAGTGTCYLGNGSFCTTFGRLYTWAEMMNGAAATNASPSGVRGICPEGWHIPSNAEWQELITFLGGSSNAGGKLKSTTTWNAPNTGATNESGFTALPAGRYDSGDGEYQSLYLWSMMWSTTAGNPSNYGMLELRESNANAFLDETSGSDRLSCRCVKD